jgi:hypothetical protein
VIKAYVDVLPSLHAERQLLAIEAASSPYMEKADRKQVIDRHVRALRRESAPKKRQSLMQAFAEAGLVVEIPKKAVKSDGRRARKGNARA